MKLNPFSYFTALLAASALISTANAANQTWLDGVGETTFWDTVSDNWNPGPKWTNGNSAIFGGNAESLSVTEAISVASITFNTPDYLISDGTLTLTSGVIANQDATIGSIITGTAISKSGSGVLTLSGANTFTGALTVSAGTVKLGNADALGTAAGGTTVVSGATLDAGGIVTTAGESFTVGGIGATGSVSALVGAGTLVGNIILTGDTTVGSNSASNLNFGTTAAPATITGAFTLTKTGTNGVWLRGPLNGVGNSLAAVVINQGTFGVESNNNALNAVPVRANVGGVFSSYGVNSQNNPVTLNGGAIGSNQGGQNYTGPVTLTANSFAGATGSDANFTISGPLSGAFTLEKQTGSIFTLSNATVGVPAINVTGGRLTLDRNVAGGFNLGTTAVTLGTGREMAVAIGTGVSGGTVTMGPGSLLGLQNGNALVGGAGFASGIVLASGSGATDAASIGGFIFGNSTNITSIISGTGDLRWRTNILGGGTNQGTLTAANNTSGWAVNSYTGATSFEGTNLTFTLASNVDNGVVNPFGNSGNAVTQTGGRNRILTTGAGTGNTSIIGNPISFVAGDAQITEFFREDGNLRLTGNVSIATTGTGKVVLNSRWGYAKSEGTFVGKGLILAGVVSGNGNLTITRTNGEDGTVHLANNANTYNGTITVDNTRGESGILILDADGAATSAAINLANPVATLNINTTNATIASLSGVADSRVSARVAGQTLTVNQATDTTFAGVIGQSVMIGAESGISLVKSGAGTLTLTGVNLHTGTTTVSGGVLAVSGNSIEDSSKLVINGGKVNPSGATEVVGQLVLGGIAKNMGTYGSMDSAATNKSDIYFVAGSTGVISVTSNPSANDYNAWISMFSVGTLTGPADDFDNDGLGNAVENVLGSNPSVSNTGLTQVSATASSFKFQHNQSNEIASDVTKSYQFSTDLIEWKASGGTTNGTTATITATTITDNVAPANDVIEVTVTVTSGPAVKVFARLVATQG